MKTTLSRNLAMILFPLLAPLATGEPVAAPVEVIPAAGKEGVASFWRSSEIIGTNVKTSNDDTIGEIVDLVVDFKSGEVLGVVISTGGFLGIADTLSSVPTSALRYDVKAEAFKTKLTKEQLEKAPRYKQDTWQAAKEGVGDQLRAFGDSVAVDTSAADNAARNEDDKGLTPLDQGSSEADINRTKDIRAALMDTQQSFNAKNIKIITRDGKVTLRGVVESESEHATVLSIAKKHAFPSLVNDQLEVKSKD